MAETYLYLSLAPESLVASMLPPSQFGTYLAAGTEERSRGQAIYFDVKPGFESDYFDLASIAERCVPHEEGTPKHSVYLGIYRVLEHVPIDALNNLHLVTKDGRVLELAPGEAPAEFPGPYHLYKELCPVHPLVASKLDPVEFCRLIVDPSGPIHVPRVCFAELNLSGLASDPRSPLTDDLPYPQIDHLRDCLAQLDEREKHTKTVDRAQPLDILYRCVKNGFFLGDRDGLRYYPFPTIEEMETRHHDWWRSASL